MPQVLPHLNHPASPDHPIFAWEEAIYFNSAESVIEVKLAGEGAAAWKTIQLTPSEFKILHFLSESFRFTRSRQEIITAVWGSDVHVMNRTIDTHISNLRRKLKESRLELITVPRGGYFLRLKAIP